MAAPAPEFSRPLRLNEVGDGTRERMIEAESDERAALARRFGLLALDRLTARLHVVPEETSWLVRGTLSADLAQACVATGDSVPAHVEAPFVVRFVRDLDTPEAEEIELSDEDCDLMALEGERIDLGETVAQSLALNLDPYPRAPDADARLRELGVLREDESGPFAALKGLKLGKDKGKA
ncbi:MAG TPA: DUF177 domain-containing protein [Sphingobium sp.]|nr:DUF177 domain-containing protein [Sphingobium sp.]